MYGQSLKRLLLAFALPLLLILCSGTISGTTASLLMGVAIATLTLELVIERWLFFAEAKHSVNVFYSH